MRIAHFVPFAPGRCGMYETVRDMVKAERLAGHVSELVDTGIEGKRSVGTVDDRSACRIVASDYDAVRDFDLFVQSSEVPKTFLAQTHQPVVQLMHGRPLSSFRLQQRKPELSPVYDIYAAKVKDPRVKLFITLWPEHVGFWRALIPDERLACVTNPPCDLDLYCPDGERHAFKPEHADGQHILVADLWREDCDPYEVVHGVLELATSRRDFRVHFLACQPPLGPWEYLFRALRKVGVLGETCGMMRNIQPWYRAVDVVLTPHYIATRIVREALACGCTLVAHRLSTHADYRCDPEKPYSVAEALARALRERHENPLSARECARTLAQAFNLPDFAERITALYQRALNS